MLKEIWNLPMEIAISASSTTRNQNYVIAQYPDDPVRYSQANLLFGGDPVGITCDIGLTTKACLHHLYRLSFYMYNVNFFPSNLSSQCQFLAGCHHLVQFLSALNGSSCVIHKSKIHQLQAESFGFWEE